MIRKKTILSAVITCVCAVIMGFAFLKTTKNTAVVIAEDSTIATSELFDMTNATYDAGVKFTDVGKINGVFKDSATIKYSIASLQTNMAMTVCSTDGEEVVTLVRASRGANYNVSLYTYYNGTFGWNTSGKQETATEIWTNTSDLPNGANFGGEYAVTFSLSGDTFSIVHTLVNNNTWTIASYALTAEDAATLAEGFTIGVRKLGQNASDVQNCYGGTGHIKITEVNNVAVGEQTVSVDSKTQTVSYADEQVIDGENVITLEYGETLKTFEKATKYTIGSLTITGDSEEISCSEDVSQVGTHSIEVEGKAYKVIVLEPLLIATSELFDMTNATYDAGVKFTDVGKINGVFKDSATIKYSIASLQTNMAMTVCSTDGEEVVTLVRASRGANYNVSLYTYYNGTFGWNTSGKQETATEIWTNTSDLPNGANFGGEYAVTFSLSGDTFSIVHTLVNNNTWTIASYALTAEDAATLAEGFTIGVRKLGQNASDVQNCYGGTGHIKITEVNNVAVGEQTVSVDSKTQTVSYADEQVIDGENVITLEYGETLKTFEKATKYTIGSLTITGDSEEISCSEDVSQVGTHSIEVEGKAYKVIVLDPIDSAELKMIKGGSIRVGTVNGGYGLRFLAMVQSTDYEALTNYYASVSYGMVILPRDYIETNGELTIDKLFGNDAIYDWSINSEYNGSKIRIINLTDLTPRFDDEYGGYVYSGAITDVKSYNLQREFVGRGYVKYETTDGEVGYKLFDYFENNIDNNSRSIYEVAEGLINNNRLDETTAKWFQDNVLNGVMYSVQYYTVENGTEELQEEITLYGLVGMSAFAPARAYTGYAFEKSYSKNVLDAILSKDTNTVLKFYFVKEES